MFNNSNELKNGKIAIIRSQIPWVVRQVHCMLKPGGLFFLGLTSTHQEKGFIEFNAHRYYGFKRLEL